MNVLLVDDHPIIHQTMRAIVRSVRSDAGFHGQFDLDAGLSQASRLQDLDLVLLDLALQAGAAGYLPKTLLPKAMADAIRVILDGGVYSPLDSA